jgi:hypothetical protein
LERLSKNNCQAKHDGYICNPNYAEGRDQEDYSSRPAQEKSYQDTISINKIDMVIHSFNPICKK